jgi:hypothetical protein
MASFIRIALMSITAAAVIAGCSAIREPAGETFDGPVVVDGYRLAWS